MDETEEILDAVRVAVSTGGLLTAGAGPLRVNAELMASLDAVMWSVEREVTVQSMTVVRASETDAVVDLAATVRFTGRSVHGFSSSGTHQLSGPVVVVREEGQWKVVDYLVDGRSLRDAIFTSDQTASIDGLTMTVLGGQVLSARESRYYIEAQNDSGAPASISRQGFGWADAGGRWRWERASLATRILPPGTTRLEARSFGSSVKEDDGRRLILQSSLGVIDLRPASAAPQRRMPLQSSLPPRRTLLVLLGCFAAIGLLGSAADASLVLLAMAFLSLTGYARHARKYRRAGTQHFALASITVLLVAGTVLFFTGNAAGQVRRSWIVDDTWWSLGTLLLIWVAATAAGVVFALRRRRVPNRRELARIAAFATSFAILLGLISAPTPAARHDQRYYVVGYVDGRATPHMTPSQPVLSATHVVTRRFTVDEGHTVTACVLDAWVVKTTTTNAWVVITNRASVANSGQVPDSIEYSSTNADPDLADFISGIIQSDRQPAQVVAGITFNAC